LAVRKAPWQLSSEAFSRLLAALSPDVETAGDRYEELRRALLRFFEWRGAWEPEVCADETLDRVARKIEDGEEVRDVAAFTRGVARMVLMEDLKRARRRPVPLLEKHEHAVSEPRPEEADEAAACLQRCLSSLLPSGRELIVRYYEGMGAAKIDNRRHLAHQMGIPPGALRSRAQRLRGRLEDCVRSCVRSRSGGTAGASGARHGSGGGHHHG